MKRFYTCVILCTAAVLYSQTTFAGRVMGLITSENDNVPLRKASVQISGLGSTVTNRNGIYLFRAVPAGHYWLIVKAAGHKTDSILFSVNFKDVQVVNVTLHRTSKEVKSESPEVGKSERKQPLGTLLSFRLSDFPVFLTLLQAGLNFIYRV